MIGRSRAHVFQRVLVTAAIALVACAVQGETLTLDLLTWQKGTILPNGWVQSGLEKYAVDPLADAAYFNGGEDWLSSPMVTQAIRKVTVESATRSGKLTRKLRIVPVIGGVLCENEARELTPPTGTTYESQTIYLTNLCATGIYLKSSTDSGSWAVRKVTIVYGEEDPEDPPTEPEPVVTDVGDVNTSEGMPSGFRISWDAVSDARAYLVNVWTNGIVGASEGTAVLGEDFSGVTNRAYAESWSVEEVNALGDYGHWTGVLMRGYESGAGVVLGTDKDLGWLLSDPIAGGGDLRVCLRLTRHTEKDSVPLLVAFVSEGETNVVGQAGPGQIADVHVFKDFYLEATNIAVGSRLLLTTQRRESGTCGRVAVGGVSVVSGYSEGSVAEFPICVECETTETAFSVGQTRAMVYGYSVAVRFEVGGTNVDSSAVVGCVDMADPPWLNCWSVSEFLPKPGRRRLDLSGFGMVTKEFNWTNGRDAGGLYAYVNGSPVEKCKAYSENAYIGGIYCRSTGSGTALTNDVALLASGSAEVALALPVRLDSERKLTSFGISFGAQQLNAGSSPTALIFEWAVFDDFNAMTDVATQWHEAARYVAGPERSEFAITLPVRGIRAGRYACLRWRVAAQANSAMIGLVEVCVTAGQRGSGMAVVVR